MEHDCDRIEGGEWQKLREKVLKRDGHKCVSCGSDNDLEVHHIVPVAQGGSNELSNLITLCLTCHNKAHRNNHHARETSETKPLPWIPTVRQVRNLVQVTHHPLRRALIVLFAKTGIGLGELCNLNRSDLHIPETEFFTYPCFSREWADLDTPLLRINSDDDGLPHGAKRVRQGTTYLPLDDETVVALLRWLAISPDMIQNEDPLFVSTVDNWGGRLSPASIRSYLETQSEHVQDTNESFSPNDFRRFFEERFPGRVSTREYILGRLPEPDPSLPQMAEHYRENVYQIH